MRNLNKPERYNVASIQAQRTMGGDVMQVDENGYYVEFRDYKWLLDEYQRVTREQKLKAIPVEAQLIDRIIELKAEVERLKEGNDCLGQMHDKEMARSAYLCEQVERLEKGIQPEGSNDAVGRAVNVLLEKGKEIARLKAEVERLDNLVRFWSEKYQNENARFLRASERIDAKEGKQS